MSNAPLPLPTPYDIASIPHFERSWGIVDLLTLLGIFLCAWGIFYLLKRVKKPPQNNLYPLLNDEILSSLQKSSLSKGEFALIWKKILRIYGDQSHGMQSFTTQVHHLLFGPHYSSEEAHKILQAVHTLMKEIACR